ncbi:unnamed protein product [Periconia digitata]|uniref:Uncharacterized protein n=1 Tax=Periconia digitata TaxID=1303443 RepID=A0A9W4UE94_9PLEO|nr:unnamed protein product [Periconia digitata]
MWLPPASSFNAAAGFARVWILFPKVWARIGGFYDCSSSTTFDEGQRNARG